MIQTMQGLRVICALIIFGNHADLSIPPLVPGAGCCVNIFFFILSGYLAAMKHWPEMQAGIYSHRNFITRRLAGAWPVHAACLLFAVLLIPVEPLTFAFDLTLTQCWIPDIDVFFSGNSVSWFLSSLLLCWALLPLLCRAVMQLPYKALAAIGVTFAAVCVATNTHVGWAYYLSVFPPLRCLDFALGILLFRLSRNIPSVSERVANTAFVISLVVLCVMFMTIHGIVREQSVTWWLPLSVFFLVCIRGCRAAKWLTSARLSALAPYTFVFFMAHVPCLRLAHNILVAVHRNPFGMPRAVLGFVLTVGTAYLLKRFVEVPGKALFVNIFSQTRPTTPPNN